MSTTPRLFLDTPLHEGATPALDAAQARYLGAVLRRREGDAVAVFNGRDGEWAARIATLGKAGATLAVGGLLRPQRAVPELRLVPAALKREAMEWLVEKATELGAARIAPVFTARSVPDRVNTARLAAIAREAAEQCERLDLPAVAEALPLPALLAGWDGVPMLVAAERSAAPPLARVAATLTPPLGLLVGPEGGFTGAELDDLRRHPFVTAVALGPRILRAETAAVAGLAVLQAVCGDAT